MPGWYDHFETGFQLQVIRAKLGDGVRQLYRLDEPMSDSLVRLLKRLEAEDVGRPQNATATIDLNGEGRRS